MNFTILTWFQITKTSLWRLRLLPLPLFMSLYYTVEQAELRLYLITQTMLNACGFPWILDKHANSLRWIACPHIIWLWLSSLILYSLWITFPVHKPLFLFFKYQALLLFDLNVLFPALQMLVYLYFSHLN